MRLLCFLGIHRWTTVSVDAVWTLQECKWCGAGRVGRWYSLFPLRPFWYWHDGWGELLGFHLSHPKEDEK